MQCIAAESSRVTAFRSAIIELVPHVRKCAEEAERQRRLPRETIESLRNCGVFRALVPRSYGGDELALGDLLDAMTQLATGCASTAWVASLAAIHNVAACWLDKDGQDEIFGAGPDVMLSSSVAPSGTLVLTAGGFRLQGKWGFSSGVDHASWVMLGANLETTPGGALPDYFLCFVRASEVILIDDWHVSGMRATGSKSVELRNVFVPNHRALLLRSVSEGAAPGLMQHRGTLYRLPWTGLFVSAFPPAALGTAVAMLEAFREHTASRVSRLSGKTFRANAGAAMRMAEASARVDAARLLFRRDLAALDRFALQGAQLTPGTVERIAYDVPFIVDACSRAILQLFRGSGGRALYENSSLQRYFRDIHAMTQHAAIDTDGAGEAYGQALFRNSVLAFGARG